MEMWFSEFHTPDVKHSIRDSDIQGNLPQSQLQSPGILPLLNHKDAPLFHVQKPLENDCMYEEY